MALRLKIDNSDFRRRLRKAEKDVVVRAYRLADHVAREVRNYAISNTGRTKEGAAINAAGNYVPVSQRTQRNTHPGGWADVTSNLANSIETKVSAHGFGVKAIIEAMAEYAEALDALTGYDVLGGAEIIARKALRKYQKELFN